MKQEFLEEKAELIKKMQWGDLSKAAKIAGVRKSTFNDWLKSDGASPEINARNMRALKQAMRKSEAILQRAIAA